MPGRHSLHGLFMSDESELDDAIQNAATRPKSVEVDGQRAENQDPTKLIEVKKFNQANSIGGFSGILKSRLNPPGAR